MSEWTSPTEEAQELLNQQDVLRRTSRWGRYQRDNWNNNARMDLLNGAVGKAMMGGAGLYGAYHAGQVFGGQGAAFAGAAAGLGGLYAVAGLHRGRAAGRAADVAYQSSMATSSPFMGPPTQAAQEAAETAARNEYSRIYDGHGLTKMMGMPRAAVGGALSAAGRVAQGAARLAFGGVNMGSVGLGVGWMAHRVAQSAQAGEYVARAALTGSPVGWLKGLASTPGGMRSRLAGASRGFMPEKALDAWMPYRGLTPGKLGGGYMGKGSPGDIRRYALNPSVVRRIGWGIAAGAVGTMWNSMVQPGAPAPTTYHDGRSMRHINDLGANAEYAAKVLGPNAGNAVPLQGMATAGAMYADDAALIGSRLLLR